MVCIASATIDQFWSKSAWILVGLTLSFFKHKSKKDIDDLIDIMNENGDDKDYDKEDFYKTKEDIQKLY